MVIEQLEAQLRVELPDNARAGARVRVAAVHEGQEIEVVYRVDRNGKRVFNYYCAGVRMERRTLLMLLCSEGACPKAQEVQQRWRTVNGHADRPARSRVTPLRVLPLMEEVPVEAAGHRCVARPASFECLTPCPVGAHAPELLRKPGWDLFEDGVWIAGGLCTDAATGASWPRFRTPDDARRWLDAQQAKTQHVLERVR